MRRFSLLALLIALAPAPALSDSTAAAGKPAKAKFDPATVVTVTGKVLGEQRVDNGKGKKAVRLVIKVGDEQVSVQLGPDSFVDGQKIRFAAGDEVTVKGSKFTYSNKYGLIAQAVTRGTETVVFRSAKGKPAWNSASGGKTGSVDHS
jgi:predicted lipoprotein